ncbi:MAG: carbohydrate ABC transporter permease [Protaetiibacter sp.]
MASPITVGETSRGARRTRRAPRDTVIAFAMLAPALILLGIFVIWPMVYSAYLSFFDWSFYQESTFVGFDNFRRVLTDQAFIDSVGRGLLFALIVVPVQLTLAFAFASLVATVGRRLAGVLKVSVFIPTVISTVIASIVFILIYQYHGGLANWVIGLFGIAPQAWLADISLALPSMAAPAVWLGLGIAALIMLAGLLDIPATYYEAAELDGANWWQRTFRITLPLMRNIILYLAIAGFVANVQQFELPLVLTKGGPQNATMLPNLLIFSHFRDDITAGYSIAAAFLLFIVMGAISALIFRFLNSAQAED